ncbi:MAG: hypothetical protein HQM03_02540 [Magnetococcales bacterium]|nr:hypothetical protein [Magnetococcales bacterium]
MTDGFGKTRGRHEGGSLPLVETTRTGIVSTLFIILVFDAQGASNNRTATGQTGGASD